MAVHHHGRRPGAVRGNRSDPEVHEGRRQTGRQQVYAGSRLKPLTSGKAPPDRPAFQPYWGKPAVRNERGDRGNVGIIRSPVRASILPNAHLARGRPELAEEPHLVRNRRGDAPAQARRGARQRSRCGGEKKLIEQAYTRGAQLGLSVWCEDEAGPFQAVPHPGVSWRPRGQPATQPHEYIRGGTTKILTLFHPATGQVRLQSAARGTNAVLHPWLRERLSAILAELP